MPTLRALQEKITDACRAVLPALVLAAPMLAISANEARAHSEHSGPHPLLHSAVGNGDLAAVVHLLEVHGADVNAKDFHGDTPLHRAAIYENHTAIAAALIKAGAMVNAKGQYGHTPLHRAAIWGYASVVSALLAAGADVNARDDGGEMPLHIAARYEHSSVVSLLLAAGAEVNAKDYYGKTPQLPATDSPPRTVKEQADEQNNPGSRADGGDSVQDIREVLNEKLVREKAEQGNAAAQTILGLAYFFGKAKVKGVDIPQDYAEAAKWLRRAAEQGRAAAQYWLSLMYHEGKGVSQDFTEAVKWTRRAAEQGHAKAQFALGAAYYKGEGVPQNHAEGVKWYRRAAEQGFDHAQYWLGVLYHIGVPELGIPTNRRGGIFGGDYREAYILFSLAAANGYKDAADMRDLAAQELSPADLSAAQEEAARRHAETQRKQGK